MPVRHRLENYRACTCVECPRTANPDELATAMAKELAREVRCRPVTTDGGAGGRNARGAAVVGTLVGASVELA